MSVFAKEKTVRVLSSCQSISIQVNVQFSVNDMSILERKSRALLNSDDSELLFNHQLRFSPVNLGEVMVVLNSPQIRLKKVDGFIFLSFEFTGINDRLSFSTYDLRLSDLIVGEPPKGVRSPAPKTANFWTRFLSTRNLH